MRFQMPTVNGRHAAAQVPTPPGHGDFGAPGERTTTIGGRPPHFEAIGEFVIANGVPEVLAAVREQLEHARRWRPLDRAR
jgi:hypothetical protein